MCIRKRALPAVWTMEGVAVRREWGWGGAAQHPGWGMKAEPDRVSAEGQPCPPFSCMHFSSTLLSSSKDKL